MDVLGKYSGCQADSRSFSRLFYQDASLIPAWGGVAGAARAWVARAGWAGAVITGGKREKWGEIREEC
ncbi:hypothetical protein E2C01_030519 [Portunus trituberculatus]|uniref:Uncharacterized protein n=1 Tax=Portunus trituberculatus TaxID=210409 RepID=A0A5B7EV24_PORTR|nr:hypothetical protein [Portunus trituberculatus]